MVWYIIWLLISQKKIVNIDNEMLGITNYVQDVYNWYKPINHNQRDQLHFEFDLPNIIFGSKLWFQLNYKNVQISLINGRLLGK